MPENNIELPIRVLQVFTILDMGGAETNLMNYFRSLDTSKIKMDFLVHRESGFYEKEILEKGSNIYRLPPINPLKLNSYKKAVDDFFKEHKGEYDIVHGQLSENGVYIYQAAKKYKVPVRIAHAHSSKNGLLLDLKTYVRFVWKRQMRSSINGYFSCGDQSSIALFGNRLANKAFVMTNSIDTSKYKINESLVKEYESKLQIKSDKTFLHVGSFTTPKNHPFIIEIFENVVKRAPDSKLLLVGEGEGKNHIQQLVKTKKLENNIIFLGKRTDVNILMQACNYFLFPSLYEGFSVAMIEAQASGMQCFISDGIPNESILLSENVEVISLKNSANYWAEKIHNKMNSLKSRDQNAYLKIRDAGYDVNDNVNVLFKEYSKLLLEKRKFI